MEDKQKAKNQILYLLKTKGVHTATNLAQQLQVSPMAIRQHLQALRSEGLVTYQEDRRPVGRPVKLWQLTAQSTHLFPDSHGDLMVDLLRGIETVFGATGIEKVLAERIQRQLNVYAKKLLAEEHHQDWRTRVAGLAQIRDGEGYMTEAIAQDDGALILVENHCPILAAARTCQQFCESELELFTAILGKEVTVTRVEHILNGDRCCAYLIRERI